MLSKAFEAALFNVGIRHSELTGLSTSSDRMDAIGNHKWKSSNEERAWTLGRYFRNVTSLKQEMSDYRVFRHDYIVESRLFRDNTHNLSNYVSSTCPPTLLPVPIRGKLNSTYSSFCLPHQLSQLPSLQIPPLVLNTAIVSVKPATLSA